MFSFGFQKAFQRGFEADDEVFDFFPAASSEAPLLIFFHGGYWQEHSKTDVLFVATRRELHRSLDEREKRVVLAHADVFAGVELGAALTNEDVARKNAFATEALHAEALRI